MNPGKLLKILLRFLLKQLLLYFVVLFTDYEIFRLIYGAEESYVNLKITLKYLQYFLSSVVWCGVIFKHLLR